MAFGLNQISSGSGSETGGVWPDYLDGSSVTASLSFTASALGVGVVMSRETWDAGTPCSISGWTLHVSQYHSGIRLHIFTKDNPGTGALTITHGNTQTIDCGWDFYEVPSDWATIPIAQSLKAALTGTTSFTGTFTNAPDTNSAVLVACGWNSASTAGSSANVTTEDRDAAVGAYARLWVGRKVGSSPPQAPLVTAAASVTGPLVAVELAANTATPADDPTPPAGRKPRLGPQHRRALGAPVRGSIGPSGGTPPDVTPPPPIPNQQPVASFTVSDNAPDAGDTVTLLSTSTDPDGDSLSYLWELAVRPSGSTASLTTPTNSTSSFVASPAGSFRVRLSVTDTPSDHGSSESPSTSQYAQDVVVAGAPSATSLRNLFGTQTSGGNGFNRAGVWRMAKLIKDFPTWDADRTWYYRGQLQATGNSWAATDHSAEYPAGGGYNSFPYNRCAVIWRSSGTASWTISLDGTPTSTLAWNATASTVEAALDTLVGANNVQVGGDGTNGFFVHFRGTKKDTDYAITVSGSGWNVRTMYVVPQFALTPIASTGEGGYTSDPTQVEANINALYNKSGAVWSVVQTHASRLAAYFPVMWLGPMEEAVCSTWGAYSPRRTTNPTTYCARYAVAYQNVVDEFKTVATANGNTVYTDYDVVVHGQDSFGGPANFGDASLCWPGDSYVDTITTHLYPTRNATPSDVSYAMSRLYDYLDPFIAEKGKTASMTEFAYSYMPNSGDNPSNWGQAVHAWVQSHHANDNWALSLYFDAGGPNYLGYSQFTDVPYPSPVSRALILQQYGS